jgi:hypothetical protein
MRTHTGPLEEARRGVFCAIFLSFLLNCATNSTSFLESSVYHFFISSGMNTAKKRKKERKKERNVSFKRDLSVPCDLVAV